MKILHTPAPWNIAGLSLNDGEALIIESEQRKYTWAVDAVGWTTIWVGPKENDETLCDGLVIGEPEEVILSVITSNERDTK